MNSRQTPDLSDELAPRVLVVDDVDDNRDMLARRLARKGYEVETASDGASALACIEADPPHLVLLDVNMPGMSGLEVAERIRESYGLAELPIIMVTARTDAEDVVDALERGANDYITKPIDFRVLLARVRTALRLKRLNDQREHFLRIASHDLKNPLTAVVGTADLLQQMLPPGTESTAQHERLLGNVAAAGYAMQRIIRDFVDAHSLEDGQLVLERRTATAAEVVETVVGMNRARATEKGIALTMALDEGLPPLWIDVERVRQALDNLVSNALKFSEPGTETRVLAACVGERVRISVVDQGPGLSPSDQARAFRRYERLTNAPTGGESSTGLGLSIVRKLVGLHGGAAGVHNNEGGPGATFWLELPCDEAAERTAPPSA